LDRRVGLGRWVVPDQPEGLGGPVNAVGKLISERVAAQREAEDGDQGGGSDEAGGEGVPPGQGGEGAVDGILVGEEVE
jgi:hypothetical protein